MKIRRGFSDWCYRWLPIIMGCHCRPERSFSYHGRPFPVCARCTGMLAGFLLAFLSCAFLEVPAWWLLAILPGAADGFRQLRTAYESSNLRRLWTGVLMGWGTMSLLIYSFVWTWRLGWKVGLLLRA